MQNLMSPLSVLEAVVDTSTLRLWTFRNQYCGGTHNGNQVWLLIQFKRASCQSYRMMTFHV